MRTSRLLGWAAATAVLALSGPLNAHADTGSDPTKTDAQALAECRQALTAFGMSTGICFWPGEGYQGPIALAAAPCNPVAAKSAANLTLEPLDAYAFPGCKDSNHLGHLPAGQAVNGYWPGIPIGSWH